MSKMNPVRVGSVPAEAHSQGSLNETVSAAERNPQPPAKLDVGPKRSDSGGFKPAAYKTASGIVRQDL